MRCSCGQEQRISGKRTLTSSRSCGHPGFTGTLTIRYRKPTPLHTELRFEAGVARVEGRKIFAKGQLFAGDLLTAEAEGIFVSVGPERFQALVAERARRLRGA